MTRAVAVSDTAVFYRARSRWTWDSPAGFSLFLGAHAPLAILIYHVRSLAALHALIALAVGVWAALRWRPEKVACVGAYIVGGEVLWRMAGAPIFWEFGKYAIVLIFLTTIVRMGTASEWRILPLLYFAALVPSIAVILIDPNITIAKAVDMVSFNLSGPLSLFVSAWFLSQLRLTSQDTRRLFTALLGPIVGIAAVTLLTTYTASNLVFTDESNFATSGGFGPNQVSVVLGLGALFAWLYALDLDAQPASRWLALGITALLGIQSAMTFSRGGLYSAGGAAVVACWYLLRDARVRRRLLILTVAGGSLTAFVILPRLDSLTNGALAARFSDMGSTHRVDIMRADVRIWLEHPLLGVGPGGAQADRHTESTLAHTEYSRMLSEHGVLGLFALAMLGAMCLEKFRRRESTRGYALTAAMITWSLLSMLHVGMRVAAFGFVFGLAQAFFSAEHRNGHVALSQAMPRY